MQAVKINKEIQDYTEKIVFGVLDTRQAICCAVGVGLAILLYTALPMPHSTMKVLISAIPVLPCGVIGFFSYNKMKGEELLLAMFNYYIKNPKRYPCIPENKIYDEKVSKYLKDVKKAALLEEPKTSDPKTKSVKAKKEKPVKQVKEKPVKTKKTKERKV